MNEFDYTLNQEEEEEEQQSVVPQETQQQTTVEPEQEFQRSPEVQAELDQRIEDLKATGNDTIAQPEFEPSRELGDFSGIEKPEESNNLGMDVAEGLASIPISGIDFAMDVVGMVPGGDVLDDMYDDFTKFKNPHIQKFREMSSIILPSLVGTGAVVNSIRAIGGLNKVQKALTAVGAVAALDAGVTYVSDTSEEGDNLMAMLDDVTGGSLNIPENWRTLEEDTPEVRRTKHMYESVGLSIFGDILGYGLNALKLMKGVKVPDFMSWFKPVDEVAEQYKAAKSLEAPQPRPGDHPLEAHVDYNTSKRDIQKTEAGVRQLELEMQTPVAKPGVDGNITPKIVSEAQNATLGMETGAATKNLVDLAAIQKGRKSPGSLAVVTTEPTYRFIARGDAAARQVAVGISKEIEKAGKFQGVVDGNFRMSKEDMQASALQYYKLAMSAKDLDELEAGFKASRSTLKITDDLFVDYASEGQAAGAVLAIRDLLDVYLGKEVSVASGVLLETTANEMNVIANGAVKLAEFADPKRARTMILDRIQLLQQEVALNKYVAGWSLNNKNWTKVLEDKNLSLEEKSEFVQNILRDFDEKAAQKVAQSKALRDGLEEAYERNPQLAKTFYDAFSMSKDIDTYDKMIKWAESQVQKRTLIKSPESGMSMLAQGFWAVRYNNVLSGLSALRAGVGNTTNLIFKATSALAGHGIMGLATRDFHNFRRAVYTYGSLYETNRRAMVHAWDSWKRVNDDPTAFMDMMRKDRLVTRNNEQWEMVEQIAQQEWYGKDFGKSMMWNWTSLNRNVAENSFMRWGTNAMVAADQYANVSLATHKSRMLAYEEVFQEVGHDVLRNPELLAKAEKKHFANMFDKNGLIKDKAVKFSSGELALNLDDGLTDFISDATNKLPALKSFLMFPRTGVNAVRLGLTYTPFSAIPGSSRMAEVLHAGNNVEKITEALRKHGVDFKNDPNGLLIYNNLKAEYTGRLALGGLIASTLMGYAMAGNIRGNGPVDAGERKKMRDNFFFRSKTIKVGNAWISFSGVEPLDTLLTLMGDLAYYGSDLGVDLKQDFFDKVAWTISASFADKTFVSGLEPLIKIFTGDTTAMSRLAANEARAFIPMSGALGVFANAISSSQKDIYNDMIGYIKNRVPVANATLPEQIDVWTGKPINDIDNPFLRSLNAVNPVPISGGSEPWRQWLMRTGWDGMRLLRKDSTGRYEYAPAERTKLYKIMGAMGLDKQIERLSKDPAINEQLSKLRAWKRTNPNYTFFELKEQTPEVYYLLNNLVSSAQKRAEAIMDVGDLIKKDKLEAHARIKSLIKNGDIDTARHVADHFQLKLDELK